MTNRASLTLMALSLVQPSISYITSLWIPQRVFAVTSEVFQVDNHGAERKGRASPVEVDTQACWLVAPPPLGHRVLGKEGKLPTPLPAGSWERKTCTIAFRKLGVRDKLPFCLDPMVSFAN